MDPDEEIEYERITDLGDLVPPMSLRVGVTLGVFDIVGESGATVAGIAERTSVRPAALRVLLEVLAERGLLTISADTDAVRLTDTGRCLTADHPVVQTAFDLGTASGQYEYAVVDLLPALVSGRSYFSSRLDTDYWNLVDRNPVDRAVLAALAATEPGPDTGPLLDDPVWASVGTVVDVGGGNGNVLVGLARRHPHLSGAVFDLPGRADSARDLIADTGLGERLRGIGGDFFDGVPSGFDCYLLNAILTDWSDRSSAALLVNLRAAMHADGTLVLSDVDPARGPGPPAAALKMLCGAEGWTRSEDEVRDLVENHGFRLDRRLPAAGARFGHVYRAG